MSGFESYAVERLLGQARAAGVPIPPELEDLAARMPTASGAPVLGHGPSWPAERYAELHPDPPIEATTCCYGSSLSGDPARCTCWEPVYQLEQAEPVPPTSAAELLVRPGLCGDCAFRPGSPERAEEYSREALYALADRGEPFWCHDGMRQPLLWRHPDLGDLPGSPDDWHPPTSGGIPYRADGRPALLCAGWATRNATGKARPRR